jgi:hypothetical protein
VVNLLADDRQLLLQIVAHHCAARMTLRRMRPVGQTGRASLGTRDGDGIVPDLKT